MHKTFFFFVILLAVHFIILSSSVFANLDKSITDTSTKSSSSKKNLELSFHTGYRQDFFQWNIGGYHPVTFNYINILSELTWDNIRIFEAELKGRYFIKNGFFGLTLSYGRIFSGENQDSDYLGSDRTNEFSRSNNASDSGSVYHIEFEGGYRFKVIKDILFLFPRAGFAVYFQNFTMTDGYQTINTFGSYTGPFDGLNSSYDTQWSSPFLGLDIQVNILNFLGVKLGYEHHFPFYSAEANWNLRLDFDHPVSFEHRANGTGMNFFGTLIFNISEAFDINTRFIYRYWTTEPGDDITYFNDGTYGTTPLNEIIWKSYSVQLGVTYKY